MEKCAAPLPPRAPHSFIGGIPCWHERFNLRLDPERPAGMSISTRGLALNAMRAQVRCGARPDVSGRAHAANRGQSPPTQKAFHGLYRPICLPWRSFEPRINTDARGLSAGEVIRVNPYESVASENRGQSLVQVNAVPCR